MNPVKIMDNRLNKITMYQLLFQSLIIISITAVIAGFLGRIAYSGTSLLESLALILFICHAANHIFAWIFKVPFNIESNWISGLILFLILAPIATGRDIFWYIGIGTLAMASKYIFTFRRKHIFNPAAIGLFIAGLFGSTVSIWWIATPVLLPVVLIFGVFVLRKVQRFEMFFSFVIFSAASIFISSYVHGFTPSLHQIFTSWPIIFFGTVMLTEPLTAPATRKLRIIYGSLVGVLFGLEFHIGTIVSSPEFALVIANIFSFLVNPKGRLKLLFKEKRRVAKDTYDFSFTLEKILKFKPGQYLEWTLGCVPVDSRGNRRYFTISSSPTEENIDMGVKFYPNGSNFKKTLFDLKPGRVVWAGELRGEFVLPEDKNKKLAFLAGGIGITPFKSMLKYIMDTGEKRDVTLLYSAKSVDEFAYKEIFDEAPFKVFYKTEIISKETIVQNIPDYRERAFYISGPHAMVEAFKSALKELGVTDIKTDFFPGYV